MAHPAGGRTSARARLGLYDGMIGVASVLHRLGHPAAALRVAETCLAERWERLGTDLHGGLSGMALALLDLGEATGEVRLLEAGLRAADMVAAGRPAPASAGSGGRVGLLRGSSGPALLFIRMFERTGDHRYLDLSAAALGADLDRCVLDGQGALKVDEGWRLMPYLDGGSVGIGLAIDDFLAHRRDDRLEQAVERHPGRRLLDLLRPAGPLPGPRRDADVSLARAGAGSRGW